MPAGLPYVHFGEVSVYLLSHILIGLLVFMMLNFVRTLLEYKKTFLDFVLFRVTPGSSQG